MKRRVGGVYGGAGAGAELKGRGMERGKNTIGQTREDRGSRRSEGERRREVEVMN